MGEYTLDYDAYIFPAKWHSKEWTIYRADGTVISGRGKGIAAAQELCGCLTSHFRKALLRYAMRSLTAGT